MSTIAERRKKLYFRLKLEAAMQDAPKCYECNKCGTHVPASEVEDSRGTQVDFKCPNGCGETLELYEP